MWKRSICDFGFCAPNSLAHDPGPDPAGGAELGDLLQQRGAGHEEERQPGREVVDVQPGGERGADVLDAVGQGERDLLRGRGPGLGHVVAGDRDRVPLRDLAAAVREDVGDQPQRRAAAGRCRCPRAMYSLSTSFWIVPVSAVARHALLLARPAGRAAAARAAGRVDRHRGGHLVQRDAVEQRPHVVDRVDGDADLADLAVRERRRRSRSPSGSAGRRRRDRPVVPAASSWW